jgi:hypothetical protein
MKCFAHIDGIYSEKKIAKNAVGVAANSQRFAFNNNFQRIACSERGRPTWMLIRACMQ